MDIVRKERLKLIESISSTIGDSVTRTNELVRKLGWDGESKKEGRNLVKCPHNEDHNIRSDRLEEHIKHCVLTSAGFGNVAREDIPDSSSFFYETTSSSVTQISVGKEQLDQLGLCLRKHTDFCCCGFGPHENWQNAFFVSKAFYKGTEEVESVDAAMNLPAYYLDTMLNAEERLKLYEYVVQAGKSMQNGPIVSFDQLEKEAEEQLKVLEMQDQDASDRPKDKIEALAELRDYKRRRQTYRGKNPTYNRRPATDVIRELIDQQMKYLEILTGRKINDYVNEESTEAASLNKDNVIADGNIVREDPDDGRSSDKRSQRDSERGDGFSRRDQRLDRSYGRERERDRDRGELRRRNRELDDRRSHRDRSRERFRRNDDRKRVRSRERERGRERSRGRSRERERERSRERSTEKDRGAEKDRIYRDRDRSRDDEASRRSRHRYGNDKGVLQETKNSDKKEKQGLSGSFDIVRSLKEIRESSGQDGEKGLLSDAVQAVEVNSSGSQSVIGKESDSSSMTERALSAETSEVFQTSSVQYDEDIVQSREYLDGRNSDEEKGRQRRRDSESRSRSRSRNRSRERKHKHRKNKHKHKKKKYRSRDESEESDRYEDDSDEWVEKT